MHNTRLNWETKLRNRGRRVPLDYSGFEHVCRDLNLALVRQNEYPHIVFDVLNIVLTQNMLVIYTPSAESIEIPYYEIKDERIIEFDYESDTIVIKIVNTLEVEPKDMEDNVIYVGVRGLANVRWRVNDQVTTRVVSGLHRKIGEQPIQLA